MNKYEDTNFAAIVFHECGRGVDLVTRAGVLSGPFKHGSSCGDAFGSSPELHVLNVNQRRIESYTFDVQQLLIDFDRLFFSVSRLRTDMEVSIKDGSE